MKLSNAAIIKSITKLPDSSISDTIPPTSQNEISIQTEESYEITPGRIFHPIVGTDHSYIKMNWQQGVTTTATAATGDFPKTLAEEEEFIKEKAKEVELNTYSDEKDESDDLEILKEEEEVVKHHAI